MMVNLTVACRAWQPAPSLVLPPRTSHMKMGDPPQQTLLTALTQTVFRPELSPQANSICPCRGSLRTRGGGEGGEGRGTHSEAVYRVLSTRNHRGRYLVNRWSRKRACSLVPFDEGRRLQSINICSRHSYCQRKNLYPDLGR